jgi:pyruvate formate lyase activating enzyme
MESATMNTEAFYGMQKTTLLDFPGEVATTLFTAGCNLKCGFCHNPELVSGYENLEAYSWDEIFKHLEKRRQLIGGVCITGGEPLIHEELPLVIDKIKSLGLKVKLDTNGLLPERLRHLDLDFIAMDVKTSFDRYPELGCYGDPQGIVQKLEQSVQWIISSGVAHEFRTTVVPGLVEEVDIEYILERIKGAGKYVLSQFRVENTLDPSFSERRPYPMDRLEKMKQMAIDAGIKSSIRSNYKS